MEKSEYLIAKEDVRVYSDELGELILPASTVLQFLVNRGIEDTFAIDRFPIGYSGDLKAGQQIYLQHSQKSFFVGAE